MLMNYFNIQSCKIVSVIFDELYVKVDLVYEKNSGELVGFCDIGDINDDL